MTSIQVPLMSGDQDPVLEYEESKPRYFESKKASNRHFTIWGMSFLLPLLVATNVITLLYFYGKTTTIEPGPVPPDYGQRIMFSGYHFPIC